MTADFLQSARWESTAMTRKIVHKTAISGVTRKFYFILVEIYFRSVFETTFCHVRAGKFTARASRARGPSLTQCDRPMQGRPEKSFFVSGGNFFRFFRFFRLF